MDAETPSQARKIPRSFTLRTSVSLKDYHIRRHKIVVWGEFFLLRQKIPFCGN